MPAPLTATIAAAQKRLTEAGVDNPALDARLLIAYALGVDRAALLTQGQRVLTGKEDSQIERLIARRAAREPVGRILGLREFWGLPFALNEATLEPRPDSETLIETALKQYGRGTTPPSRLLDLGTGTGCLLLALLHEWPEAMGLGIDLAPRAVEQAQANAERLGLTGRATFRVGNWLEGVEGPFDLILSNPPYIPEKDIDCLEPEVKNFDPRLALAGGADGLAPYRALIPRLPALLTPHGLALIEVGIGQAETVLALMCTAGFVNPQSVQDLGGLPRCLFGTKGSCPPLFTPR